MLTVPISEASGGWRWGLFAWAATALVALLPWIACSGTTAPDEVDGPHRRCLDVARTRLGWAMAVFFGLQSLQAYSVFGWFAELYRDAGFSAHDGRAAARRDHRRSASRCRS